MPFSDRLEVMTGDMFATPLPDVDFVLLSNVLHDWDIPECRHLVTRSTRICRPCARPSRTDSLCTPIPARMYVRRVQTLQLRTPLDTCVIPVRDLPSLCSSV